SLARRQWANHCFTKYSEEHQAVKVHSWSSASGNDAPRFRHAVFCPASHFIDRSVSFIGGLCLNKLNRFN
ncbi:hypothetical protein ACWIVX_04035, partial [Enterobacter asburiae]